MAVKEITQETLINESINFLNSVGVQHVMGREWNWTSGMIGYHLPNLINRLEHFDNPQLVVDNLWSEALIALEAYNAWTADQPATMQRLKKLAEIGVEIDWQVHGEPV